jgi:putative ABC transport system ATP-binding protein
MPAPTVRTADLRKDYVMGHAMIHALDGVDLAFEAGSFTAVIGPSGSGKSTLLHLLGGLDRPTQGSIEVGGTSLERLDENALATYRRTQVGFIFQTFNLIQSMTTQDNVAFPMWFAGVPPRRRAERALDVLQKVGLADRASHRPDELSGGQQQRVAIARALVNDPAIVLADEPTGNLDSQSGLQIMRVLADLHREGRTVIVVSHDPRIGHFATETVRLLDGRVVSEGESEAALLMAGDPQQGEQEVRS